MKRIVFVLLVAGFAPACSALDKGATEATAQAINSGVQQLQSELQSANSSLTALKATVQNLGTEIRTFYGGLEYVLMAIAQALYFALGLALFYIFDRGRVARDIW